MLWIVLFAGTAVVVECFMRLPVGGQARIMLDTMRRVTRTLRSPRISDHWKERVLPVYAGRLLKTSVILFVLVCLAIAPMLIAGLAADAAGLPFMTFLTSAGAILGSTVFAVVYVSVRKRLV